MTTTPRGRDRLASRCGECGDWRYAGLCRTCLIVTRREHAMSYPPERHEAERDEHETALSRGQCTHTRPCPACERSRNR